MSIAGTWNIIISTPIGTQHVTIELTEHDDGIQGFARGKAETVPLIHPTFDGNRLTWAQSITKPIRLNLIFDVRFDGDTLSGTSKAGLLPTSKVTGTRASSH